MDEGLGGKAPIEEGSILVCACVCLCVVSGIFFLYHIALEKLQDFTEFH